jgi:general secretion pathway protein M
MKEWFNQLEARERKIVIAGGILLVVLGVYALMWTPFVSGLENLRKSTVEKQELLVWMQDAAQEVKTLRAQNPKQINQGGAEQSILGVIDRTAKQSKLGSAVKRVKPEGSTKAHVWLEDAVFNDVIRWLENMDNRQNIKIVSSMVDKQDSPGVVNIRLVLERSI